MAEKTEKKHGDEEPVTLTQRVAAKADKLKWIIVAAVALLAIAGIVVTQQRRQRSDREKAAENALYQATIDLSAQPEGAAEGVAAFGKIAKDYEGLPTGGRALILQFSYAFNTRDFAAAERFARDFIRLYPQNPMASRVRLALGQALLEQGELSQAVAAFREVAAAGAQELLPEAKLALAQALERQAEEARDDPDEHRRRLEAAEAEYNDIVVRSQISIPAQRGYWPSEIVLPADFALAAIKDRLAGHNHPSPRAIEDTGVTARDLEDARLVAEPPSEGEEAGTEEDAETADGDAPAPEEAR